LMEMERKLARLELSLVKIEALNQRTFNLLSALGVGGLTFATTVKN
jgi:hypothetical protein